MGTIEVKSNDNKIDVKSKEKKKKKQEIEKIFNHLTMDIEIWRSLFDHVIQPIIDHTKKIDI